MSSPDVYFIVYILYTLYTDLLLTVKSCYSLLFSLTFFFLFLFFNGFFFFTCIRTHTHTHTRIIIYFNFFFILHKCEKTENKTCSLAIQIFQQVALGEILHVFSSLSQQKRFFLSVTQSSIVININCLILNFFFSNQHRPTTDTNRVNFFFYSIVRIVGKIITIFFFSHKSKIF